MTTQPTFRVLADGLEFPEGPVVLASGAVLLVEIKGKRITQIDTDGTKTVVAQLSGGPNGLAMGPDSALYICNNGGGISFGEHDGLTMPMPGPVDYSGGRIERLDLETGALREVCRSTGDGDLLMPNDIVFDRQGGFYFTDFGRRQPGGMLFGALYYGQIDGSPPVKVVGDLITPNGVGLSPDEARVYVAETQTGRSKAFDIIAPGQVAPIAHTNPGKALHAQVEGFRRYDSLAIEANGNLCIASITPGNITVLSPEGKLIDSVELPEPFPTNIAFGGTDMRTAYITLSGTGRLIVMNWPRPGLRLNFQQRAAI